MESIQAQEAEQAPVCAVTCQLWMDLVAGAETIATTVALGINARASSRDVSAIPTAKDQGERDGGSVTQEVPGPRDLATSGLATRVPIARLSP